MKKINERRNTKIFCIDAYVIQDMISIEKRYGMILISVATHENKIDHNYLIRIAGTDDNINGIFDIEIEVDCGSVYEKERHTICDFSNINKLKNLNNLLDNSRF